MLVKPWFAALEGRLHSAYGILYMDILAASNTAAALHLALQFHLSKLGAKLNKTTSSRASPWTFETSIAKLRIMVSFAVENLLDCVLVSGPGSLWICDNLAIPYMEVLEICI